MPFPRQARRIGGLALVLLALALFWHHGVRPNLFPKRFGIVADGRVYRSGKLTPEATRRIVEARHVRTIIDLGAWPEGSPDDRLAQRTADALGVTRYRFDLVGDATGNPNWYLETLRLMTDPARQPVLVHCGAGTERTGAAVVLYRSIIDGISLETAYAEADAAGHSPQRNPRLRAVLDRWAPAIERAYREGGSVAGADPLPAPQPVSSAPDS